MREVAVIGIGMTKWGELWNKSLRDIYVETALMAIDDSGVDHIDSMYVGGLFRLCSCALNKSGDSLCIRRACLEARIYGGRQRDE